MGRKLRGFATAMHGVDPKLAVGLTGVTSMLGDNDGSECCGTRGAQYVFSMTMFREVGAELDFIVDHVYENFHATNAGIQTFPQHVQRINPVRWIQDMFAKYSPDHRSNIPVYVTEFNTMPPGGFVTAPAANSTYQFVNGLVIADWFGVYQTIGAEMAIHHDQLDNPFGSYVTYSDDTGSRISTQAAAYAMALFTQHWGTRLTATAYRSPTHETPFPDTTRTNLPPGGTGLGFPRQTSYSSLSADGNKLYVMLINKSGADPVVPTEADMPLATTISLKGFAPKPAATVWTLNGRNLSATNVVTTIAPNYEHDPDAFGLSQTKITNAAGTFAYTTPAHSVTVIELDRAAAPRPDSARTLPATGGGEPNAALLTLAAALAGFALLRRRAARAARAAKGSRG